VTEGEQGMLQECSRSCCSRDAPSTVSVSFPSGSWFLAVPAVGAEEEGSPFSFEELKGLTYTQAAINETLRLYPSVPLDLK